MLKHEFDVHDVTMNTFSVYKVSSNVWEIVFDFLFGIFEEHALVTTRDLFEQVRDEMCPLSCVGKHFDSSPMMHFSRNSRVHEELLLSRMRLKIHLFKVICLLVMVPMLLKGVTRRVAPSSV